MPRPGVVAHAQRVRAVPVVTCLLLCHPAIGLPTTPDDVPSSVELRWRSGEHQAALTSSLCTAGPIGSANSRSRAARSAGRCRWPLTRRNCLPASTIPAAHQCSAIRPSRQRLTLLACSRHTEIIDSMALVERSVRARVGGTPRRSTVSVSSRPSRRLAAAPGWVRSSSLASASSAASACSAERRGRRRSSCVRHCCEVVAVGNLSRF